MAFWKLSKLVLGGGLLFSINLRKINIEDKTQPNKQVLSVCISFLSRNVINFRNSVAQKDVCRPNLEMFSGLIMLQSDTYRKVRMYCS